MRFVFLYVHCLWCFDVRGVFEEFKWTCLRKIKLCFCFIFISLLLAIVISTSFFFFGVVRRWRVSSYRQITELRCTIVFPQLVLGLVFSWISFNSDECICLYIFFGTFSLFAIFIFFWNRFVFFFFFWRFCFG